eukprot:TRINITY_DN4598_c0_g1_i1.p1 TRINITY_DN4598_c0_g1~~TRINITY_DN4598_c0_g1_i1.p1  ORF type:complete len:372 (-),score=74.50 TRINITY_DN4598_c0_g1_i1:660-1775(-)
MAVMQAVVCRKLGDPTSPLKEEGSALLLDPAHACPSPGDAFRSGTWVRIRVAAASLNFADALQVMGKYQERPPLPFIPGCEVSGHITEVGPAVGERLQVGARVCAVVGTGGFAEEVICDMHAVFALPARCRLLGAAGLPVAFGTAHLALVHRAGLQRGQVLLILGAAGGVGMAAVQIGKLCGATVIACARGASKAGFLRGLGADCVVDTSAVAKAGGSLREMVKAFLRERQRSGVDVLLDPVGGGQFKEALKTLSWGAQVLLVGFASGEIPTIAANVALVKNLTLHGIYWGSYMSHEPRVLHASMQTLLAWLAEGQIVVHVSHHVLLPQINEGFSALLGRKATGKVMVVVSAMEDVDNKPYASVNAPKSCL